MPKQHVYRISDYAIHNAHKKQRAVYLPAKLSDRPYLPGNSLSRQRNALQIKSLAGDIRYFDRHPFLPAGSVLEAVHGNGCGSAFHAGRGLWIEFPDACRLFMDRFSFPAVRE